MTVDLSYQVSSPADRTLFLEIPLNNGQDPETGVFVPEKYKASSSVDLILWMHGYKHSDKPISEYWTMRQFQFREDLNPVKKNAILVAPTLGQNSEAGDLLKSARADDYLGQVMDALHAYGPHKTQSVPDVGNIVLACHSGGGVPMLALTGAISKYQSNIKECWGFDCLYNAGEETKWATWAMGRADAKLYFYYLPGTQTESVSKALKGKNLANVTVTESDAVSHDDVPLAHWSDRIRKAYPTFGPR